MCVHAALFSPVVYIDPGVRTPRGDYPGDIGGGNEVINRTELSPTCTFFLKNRKQIRCLEVVKNKRLFSLVYYSPLLRVTGSGCISAVSLSVCLWKERGAVIH